MTISWVKQVGFKSNKAYNYQCLNSGSLQDTTQWFTKVKKSPFSITSLVATWLNLRMHIGCKVLSTCKDRIHKEQLKNQVRNDITILLHHPYILCQFNVCVVCYELCKSNWLLVSHATFPTLSFYNYPCPGIFPPTKFKLWFTEYRVHEVQISKFLSNFQKSKFLTLNDVDCIF